MARSLAVLCLAAALVLAQAKNLVLQESGGALGSSAWLTYPTTLSRYPQCCGDRDHCQMLRLSESVLSAAALAGPQLRLRLEGEAGDPEVVLEFEEETGTVTGQALVDSSLYYIEPTSPEERRSAPCLTEGQSQYMSFYYKLILIQENGALPPGLISLLKGEPKGGCCQDSDTCQLVSISSALLSQKKELVTIPLAWRNPQLHSDTLEHFTLVETFPKECKGFCDIYKYAGAGKLSARVVMKNSLPEATMEGAGLIFTAKFCEADGEYVLTSAPGKQESRIVPILDGRLTVAGCQYQDNYCDFRFHHVGEQALAAGSDFTTGCRDLCAADTACKYWTWFTSRGSTTCYLLDSCAEERDAACLLNGNCVSGPEDCTNSTVVVDGCEKPRAPSPEYIPWQCSDTQGNTLTAEQLNATIDIGTTCYLRCEAWETESGSQGYLESTCDSDGEWTATAPHNGDAALKVPLGPYPKPTGSGLSCQCSPLHVVWEPTAEPSPYNYYDPHQPELDGAFFICESPAITSDNTYILQPDNACAFWCDDHLAATLSCNDGIWSGQPELGFWCYNIPTVRGYSTTAAPDTGVETTTTAAPDTADETTTAGDCPIYADTEFATAFYLGETFTASTPEECKRDCRQNPSCKAFIFYSGQSGCYLYTSAVGTKEEDVSDYHSGWLDC